MPANLKRRCMSTGFPSYRIKIQAVICKERGEKARKKKREEVL